MNIMRFRPLFFFISTALIVFGTYSMVVWKFNVSIDFTGGSVWQIKVDGVKDKSEIGKVFEKNNVKYYQIDDEGEGLYSIKFAPIGSDERKKMEEGFKGLSKNFGEIKYETIGPVLGRELIVKTIIAVMLSAISLLIFIGRRFGDMSFGASAVLAMFHDAFVLTAAFSVLGHFFGAEIDVLFVTALLTTLSSSVHDTVVTFDRIRELRRKDYKTDWTELANRAVSETIVRSINNSMTIIIMLFALVMLGSEVTRWFGAALLIGVVCGTYSSTGVAIPLVLWWKNSSKKA